MSLPYIPPPEYHLWRIPIHGFGLLVATGIIVGNAIARRRARKTGLDERKYEAVVFWTVGVGLVMSHMLDTIFYHPDVLRQNLLELFMVWNGLSSFGGFIGAALAFTVYTRRAKLDAWRYADAICYGLPVGWLFGRLGCSVVHDHPGRPSHSPLAVGPGAAWPDGPRFDLGLLEFMLTPLLIAAVLLVGYLRDRSVAAAGGAEAPRSWVHKRGAIVATLAGAYAPIRFGLDFLRVGPPLGDPRYGGLTPAQWACLGLLAFAVWVAVRPDRAADGPPPRAAAAQ
jgi:phosphatidylglycerol:prolipoprotein diacylglycerol transferase